MLRKNPPKHAGQPPGPPPATEEIIVDKTTTDSRWGYEDLYELSDPVGNSAGRGKKVSRGAFITWYCDQPFTFLATDTSHWDPDPAQPWKTLPLTDNTAFVALTSSVVVPPRPGLPKHSLTLRVNGNSGDTRGYTITIPQLALTNLSPLRKQADNPPDNTLVRATVILQ
jgi:hypothetical protein